MADAVDLIATADAPAQPAAAPAAIDVDDPGAAATATTNGASSSAAPAPSAPQLPPPPQRMPSSGGSQAAVRALDSKICEEDAPAALAAIATTITLVNNVINHPDEPKYRKVRSNNPGISKKLLHCPGGQDLLLALGFRTKVMDFEEFWMVDDSPVLFRVFAECLIVLERYRELVEYKIEKNAKERRERLANMNDDRARVLADIEADKQARRDREDMRQQGRAS